MDLPKSVFGKSPGSVEAIIEAENGRNGHTGTIERYTILSNAPPIGIATSKEGWDDAYRKFSNVFGAPNDPTYKATLSYAKKSE